MHLEWLNNWCCWIAPDSFNVVHALHATWQNSTCFCFICHCFTCTCSFIIVDSFFHHACVLGFFLVLLLFFLSIWNGERSRERANTIVPCFIIACREAERERERDDARYTCIILTVKYLYMGAFFIAVCLFLFFYWLVLFSQMRRSSRFVLLRWCVWH